jgi:hypothetical protein
MTSARFSRFERSLKVMVYGALGKRGEKGTCGERTRELLVCTKSLLLLMSCLTATLKKKATKFIGQSSVLEFQYMWN